MGIEIPKYLQTDPVRTTSIKQEKKLAKQLGGRLTSNSGATFGENDLNSADFSIEAKTTTKKGYRVTVEEFKQIEDRTPKGKIAIQLIEFTEHRNKELIVIEKNELFGLLGLL